MTISFDFDDTLTRPEVLSIALGLMAIGNHVVILTARQSDISDVTEFALENGFHQVIFSKQGEKWLKMIQHEVDLHIDDAEYEVRLCLENNLNALNTNPLETLSHRIFKELLRMRGF